MANYSYVALDSGGKEQKGLVDGSDQNEALRRIREMGYFPTRIAPTRRGASSATISKETDLISGRPIRVRGGFLRPAIPVKILAVFTRQLATLLEAGLPLLRGLRLLEEQETSGELKKIIHAI